MRFYATTPARRLGQVLGDIGLVLWIVLWCWIGRVVRDMVVSLSDPVLGIQDRATGLARNLHDASGRLSDVPMVGDRLREPFDTLSGTGDDIASQSADLARRIHDLGVLLGVVVAAIPIVLVTVWWLARRIAFVRMSAVAQRFVDADADLDLFALRAMSRQPLPRLARISDDPVGAWRRGDAEVVRRLAALELRTEGLDVP